MKIKKKRINSLYIHIPFCKKICPYCDFYRLYSNPKREDGYIFKIITKINYISKNFKRFRTIYIGGGTPSILSFTNIKKLLRALKKVKRLNTEFTFEINPEDIEIEKLKLLKKYGVNRLSIGIQSFNKDILSSIERPFLNDIDERIKLVKKFFKNINLDLIYGFKNQTFDILKNDLVKLVSFKPKHISIYSLIVDEGSIFYTKKYKEQDEDESRLFYDYITNFLIKNKYIHYEVSNFSLKKRFKSKHNINYWLDNEYIGVGLSSHGYIKPYRYNVTKNFTKYIKDNLVINKELITKEEDYKIFLLTNLRLTNGFSLKRFKKIFNYSFYEKNKQLIDDLINKRLCEIKKDRFFLTYEGMMIMDSILIKFI